MAPDLNSLPPSHSAQGVAEPGGTPAPANQPTSTDDTSHPTSISSTSHDAPSSNPRLRQSPSARAAMRINLHDPAPAGDGERRQRPSQPHRTPSSGRREGFSGSGLPSPRSPIVAGLAQGDPHHQRAPSLGELHQELEQEQEAQVNRLLQMIRQQQTQLQQLQSQNAAGSTSADPAAASAAGTAITDDPQSTPPRATTPSAGAPGSFALPHAHPPRQLSPAAHTASSPHSIRSRSRRSSRSSPSYAMAPTSPTASAAPPEVAGSSAGRDEAAFYAAETQSLARENQMLRARIRELERQVRETERIGRGEGERKDDEGRADGAPPETANL